jgi:hypothetical protein
MPFSLGVNVRPPLCGAASLSSSPGSTAAGSQGVREVPWKRRRRLWPLPAGCLRRLPSSFPPDPSLGSYGDMGFAFVMRREPQHALAWSERARPGTRGTCHQRDATVQKTRGVDGRHASKQACGRFGGWRLVSHRLAMGRLRVVCRGRRGQRVGAFGDRCSPVNGQIHCSSAAGSPAPRQHRRAPSGNPATTRE